VSGEPRFESSARAQAGLADMEQQPLLAFTVATWRLALPLSHIRRIVPLPFLQAPLGAPRFVEGFFDFQGAPVAVLRLDRLFGLEEEKLGVYTPLLVLDVDALAVALHVDRIDGILNARESEVQPIGRDETFNACVVGRIGDRGETVYLLAKDELLLAEERAKIASHRVMRQQRLADLETPLAHAG
jgi:chemotaxis signal transduction protein